MQQVQGTVLDELVPGKVPVFIVSPNLNDGDALAKTLSYHLMDANAPKKSDFESGHLNYFNNSASRKLFSRIAENDFVCAESDKDTVKFIIDKDFRNKTIWGLQLSYATFRDLQIAEAYPDSFIIFLYGAPIKEIAASNAPTDLIAQTFSSFQQRRNNAVALHVNDTILLPGVILSALPVDVTSVRVFYNNDFKKVINQPCVPLDGEGTDAYEQFVGANLLVGSGAWFRGDEVLIVLTISSFTHKNEVIERVTQFINSFSVRPQVYLIVENEEVYFSVKEALAKLSESLNCNVIITDKNNRNNAELTKCVNKVIADTECSYVILDNTRLTYSIPDMLKAYLGDAAPTFVSSSLLSGKVINAASDVISLVDVMATRQGVENISFPKEVWKSIDGFDESLKYDTIIWDFCIRSLAKPDSFAHEIDAQLLYPEFTIIRKAAEDESDFTSIARKHAQTYSSNMGSVLNLSAKNQIVVREETVDLHSKVLSLNIELDKSYQDNKAAGTQMALLRNHINHIENDRLFRISKKLKHYKKIFIKDAKSDSNSLKKILKFFVFAFTRTGAFIIRKVFKRVFRAIYLWVEDRPVKLVFLDKSDGDQTLSYEDWIKAKSNVKLLKSRFNSGKHELKNKPKISILVPVYDPPLSFLHDAIKSVLNQFYSNWELCIADDCSKNPQIKRLLNAYAMKDDRIKVDFRTTNGHISASSNSALAMATGDYVLLLDHDDLLTPDCLYEIVKHINEHPEDELIYSDEDKIDGHGNRSSPFFKPDWSPDKFLSINYISHVVVMKRELIEKVGGFRLGFEGSQDYDLLLRVSEQTEHIGHIPKILYNWRIHSASVASEEGDAKPYAYIAAKKALEEALVRRNTPGEVAFQSVRGSYRIKYRIQSFDKVSVLIPTKDGVKMLKNTIDSIFEFTTYPNYEVVVLNNNSKTPEFFELMKEYEDKYGDKFKCVEASFPFNFSRLMNLGAKESSGEYILMLNNDVEILHKDWMTTMVSYAQFKKNGAIGVKLLYPDDTIQHAGTVIGLGDIRVAGHVFVGFYKDSPGYYNYLQSVTNTSAVTAACLMCRRDVYEEVGGMEELLEVEYNDVDFCLRILDKGYYNIYLPDVVLYHYESATRGHPQQTKESYERHIREVKFFKDKWDKYIKRDPFYNPNLSLDEGDYRMNLSLTEEETNFK